MSFKSVKLVFEKEVEIVGINYDTISLSNGDVIFHNHDADCCEHNYADFASLEDTTFMEQKFNELVFEKSEYGFLLNGYLVNCYTIQNGYYSSDVDICYYQRNKDDSFKIFNIDCEHKEE